MIFNREWDSTCPRVWDKWEVDGVKWTVEDLAPEDDERALEILLKYQCPEEIICVTAGIMDDPISLNHLCDLYRTCMSERTSLGCYREENGRRILAGVNVCLVKCVGDDFTSYFEKEGKAWKHLCDTYKFMVGDIDEFQLLDTDKYLDGIGLVVAKEYRGARLGARILNAREPLCRALGVKGTLTTFTGVASQKLAEGCGFKLVKQKSLKELAEVGLNFPNNEERFLKVTIKKYE